VDSGYSNTMGFASSNDAYSRDAYPGAEVRKRGLLITASAFWLVAVFVCVYLLALHELTPGRVGNVRGWPGSHLVHLEHGTKTLLVFIHPGCPCTEATITELRRILDENGNFVRASVLVFRPSAAASNWERTDLYDRLARFPDVRVKLDMDGKEAERFQVFTSGTVLLFDESGRLLYSGGLTKARGMSGENQSTREIAQAIKANGDGIFTRSVFGCDLFNPNRLTMGIR